ncbi:MAG: hypothetical protein R2812_06580 [Gelidibacter sp.]
MNHLDIRKPSEFLMIGNSLKSDVLPLVNIKAQAIHIPFPYINGCMNWLMKIRVILKIIKQ